MFPRFLAALSALVTTIAANAQTSGPYDAESFESPRFALGQLPGLGFADGQDGWMLFDDIALQPNLAAVQVQTAVVRSGDRAIAWHAGLMTPGCFGELRRNALFNLTTGVIESEMDFMITSSAHPSSFWEFYTQPVPIPSACQMRWFIAANGLVEYLSTPNRNLIHTSFVVTKDTWHHARTVVDILGNTTRIFIDDTLVGAGQPIASVVLPAHGFTQIDVDGAGDDTFYLDNFTVRERRSSLGLSVDLPHIAANRRSVLGFDLSADAAHANHAYALLASFSGSTPGIALAPGQVLPLVPDAFFGIVAGALGSPALPGFLGTLSPDGTAQASFDTQAPVLPSLIGTTVTFAWFTYYPTIAASEAVHVVITP